MPMRKVRLVLLLFGIAAIGILVLPLKIPYSIRTTGKLMPAKEWILSKGSDGRLIENLFDHRRGVSQNFAVKQFDRGDAVQFQLNQDLTSSCNVAAGDTVGSIRSNEIERQIVRLTGELTSATATLQLYLSGEKESVVNEAQRRLAFEKRQAIEEKKKFDRIKELYGRNLISHQEYELAQGDAQLVDMKVAIARAKLNTVKSGAKDEQIQMIQARIGALENEIRTLRNRLDEHTLVAPISGIAYRSFSTDTLVVVADTTEYVVLMPIRWHQRALISANQDVDLTKSEVASAAGLLEKLDRGVHTINGRQFLMATAVVQQPNSEFVPGLMIDCSISCGEVSAFEFIVRLVKSFLS